ncbi:hypothetical protein KFE25_001077 [Diacronema lutheri]|uniref:Alpha 1,4-glycosyltransferase domain-containing protein n=1 Tax=Diacronema lutheri TaxID=2081491 RepID=A0A8J5XD14_DIALT|nr:hypothetical protein KFE25_001077 [Diacronema lutheri]
MLAVLVLAAVRDGVGSELTRSASSLVHFVALYPAGVRIGSLCAIESYARMATAAHPRQAGGGGHNVVLWVLNRTQVLKDHHQVLAGLAVDVAKANAQRGDASWFQLTIAETSYEHIFAGTSLGTFYATRTRASLGTFGNQNRANAARLALVSKHGGLYVDNDIVFLRDTAHLQKANFVALESGCQLNNSPFQFAARGSPFLKRLMDKFVERYRGSTWGAQGPRLFSRKVMQVCPVTFARASGCNITHFLASVGSARVDDEPWCQDLHVFTQKDFAPIHWGNKAAFLAPDDGTYSAAADNLPRPMCENTRLVARAQGAFQIHLYHSQLTKPEAALCKRDMRRYLRSSISRLRACMCPRVHAARFFGAHSRSRLASNESSATEREELSGKAPNRLDRGCQSIV